MKTLVLDTFGRITRFDPVHPFFYQHKIAGELAFVGSARGNQHKKNVAVSDIYKALMDNDWQTDNWQLLVLLPLAETPRPIHCLPASYCQSDLLNTLIDKTIIPMEEQQCQPKRTVVVFFDTVPRHEVTAEPLSPGEKKKYQIDTTGYIHETGTIDPLFSLADLRELECAWPSPFDLHNRRIDQGIDGLPDELGKELEEKCKQSCSILTNLIERKITSLANYASQNSSLFLDEETFNTIKKRFFRELEDYKQKNISAFLSYTPSNHLKKILRETYSINGVINGKNVSVLRYPISGYKKNPSHRVVELTYIILSLVEQGEEFPLIEGKPLRTNVVIDWNIFSEVLGKTLTRWQGAREELETADNQVTESTVQWMQACPGHSDVSDNKCAPMPAARISDWQAWRANTDRVINEFRRFHEKSHTLLNHFRRRIPEHDYTQQKAISNLVSVEEKLTTEEKNLKEKLLAAPYKSLQGPILNWRKKRESLAERARFYFAEQPSLFAVSFLYFISLIILGLPPALFYLDQHTFSGFRMPIEYIFPGSVFIIAIMPLIILNFVDRYRLKVLREDLNRAIEETGSQLQEVFNSNAGFLYHLCVLLVNQHNLVTVRNEEKKKNFRHQRSHFFINQLVLHAQGFNQLGISPVRIETGEHEVSGLVFSRPCEEQPFFTATSSLKKDFSYIVNNEGAKQQYTSRHMPGIQLIEIMNDIPPGVLS